MPLLAEALAAAWEIRNEGYRAYAQDALWAHLQGPEARRLLGAELAAALELRDLPWLDNPGLDVLRRLVPYLPESLLEEALDTALGIEDEETRAKTLEILAPYLPDSLLQGVLEAVASIVDEATAGRNSGEHGTLFAPVTDEAGPGYSPGHQGPRDPAGSAAGPGAVPARRAAGGGRERQSRSWAKIRPGGRCP